MPYNYTLINGVVNQTSNLRYIADTLAAIRELAEKEDGWIGKYALQIPCEVLYDIHRKLERLSDCLFEEMQAENEREC